MLCRHEGVRSPPLVDDSILFRIRKGSFNGTSLGTSIAISMSGFGVETVSLSNWGLYLNDF